MINREARDRLALALRRFAAGRITNDECDDTVIEFTCQRDRPGMCDCGYDLRGGPHERCPECGELSDPALPEIARFAWSLYDDLNRYTCKGRHAMSREQRRIIARAVAFLKTDREYTQEVFSRLTSGPRAVALWSLAPPATAAVITLALWGKAAALIVGIGVYLTLIGVMWCWALISSWRCAAPNEPHAANVDDESIEHRWPFESAEELQAAAARPMFLAGAKPTAR